MSKQSVSSDTHNLIDIPHIGILALPKDLPQTIQTSIARHAHGLTHEKSGVPVNFNAPKDVPDIYIGGKNNFPQPKSGPVQPTLDTDDPRTKTGNMGNTQNAPVNGLRPPITKEANPDAPQMSIGNAPLPGAADVTQPREQ